jgi:hypothetical protein
MSRESLASCPQNRTVKLRSRHFLDTRLQAKASQMFKSEVTKRGLGAGTVPRRRFDSLSAHLGLGRILSNKSLPGRNGRDKARKREKGACTDALSPLFPKVVSHPLLVRIFVQMTALIFLATAAPAEVVAAGFFPFGFCDFVIE